MEGNMRDIVFKALTSTSSKKQDVCVQESIERDGILAKTERRCRYFVTGKTHIEDINDIEKLAELQFANVPYRKRHYYIQKVRDTQTGTDRLLCKIAGMFYAVYNNDIYCIAYVHSFKISFATLSVPDEGRTHESP
jgi:hypothetical protein